MERSSVTALTGGPSRLDLRKTAIRIFNRVLKKGDSLEDAIRYYGSEFKSEERPWLVENCSGVLRWKGRIDALLGHYSRRKSPSGWLRGALSLGTYQILAQDQERAPLMVSETVELVKQTEGVPSSRFANAILRKVLSESSSPLLLEENADWSSLPNWVWDRVVRERGLEWAKVFGETCLERPTVWARSKPGWKTFSESEDAWALPSGKVDELEGYKEGNFFVQNISSQRLVQEVSAHLKEKAQGREIRILDLCAAPGGKAIGLAWNGFKVFATDVSPQRLETLEENRKRISPAGLEVIPYSEWRAVSSLDLIWVDAPCSGSGTLRSHPEIRWVRGEKELENLKETQHGLLKEAWEALEEGSLLVYSVCSVLHEEGRDQIHKLGLQSHVIEEWSFDPQGLKGADGFWACLLEK